MLAAGQDSYSIKTAHLLYGRVYDLLTDGRIVVYVKDLLGENVVGWGAHFSEQRMTALDDFQAGRFSLAPALHLHTMPALSRLAYSAGLQLYSTGQFIWQHSPASQ